MTRLELEDLILLKLDLTGNSDARLLTDIRRVDKLLSRETIKFIDILDTKGGRILDTASNRRKLLDIERVLFATLKKSNYGDAINAYLTNFKKVETITKDINSGVNGIKDYDAALRNRLSAEKKGIIASTTKQLMHKTRFDAQFSSKVKEQLGNAIVYGEKSQQLKKRLNDFIVGTKRGEWSRWVGQVSMDSVRLYDGKVQTAIAKEYKLNAARYIGGLVRDSRRQCHRWVGMEVIKFGEQLQREVAWAKANGEGYSRQLVLTVENWMSVLGGHNCLHTAIAFFINDVGAKDLLTETAKSLEAQREAKPKRKPKAKETKKAFKASTVEEAKQYIFDNFTREVEDKTTYYNRYRQRQVNFEGLKLKELNEIISGLHAVLGKYDLKVSELGFQKKRRASLGTYWHPRVNKQVRDFTDAINVQKTYAKNSKTQSKEAWSDYDLIKKKNKDLLERHLKGEINLKNMTDAKARKRLKSMENADTPLVMNLVDTPLEALMIHEALHAVYFRKKLADKFHLMLVKHNVKREDWYKVSEYGGSVITELFTELGTRIHYGLKTPQNLVDAFLETVKDL